MGIPSIPPVIVKGAGKPADDATVVSTIKARTKAVSPTIRQRSGAVANKAAGENSPLDSHSEPRALIRINKEAVDQALGNIKEIAKRIDPERQAGFYKHASMLLGGSAKDKPFLLNCLAKIYLSAPDRNHPKAVDPEWVDDQDVLWGDELLFLFEVSPQLDKLSDKGKAYFSEALASRTDTVRSEPASLQALESALMKAKHHAELG